MVARKARRKTIVLTFAANSSTESEAGRMRRAEPMPVVRMPLRNPLDTITQEQLRSLRLTWEMVNDLLRAVSNVDAAIGERIHAGAAIEPGEEKFNKHGEALIGGRR